LFIQFGVEVGTSDELDTQNVAMLDGVVQVQLDLVDVGPQVPLEYQRDASSVIGDIYI
jgi:hypothetical protein